MYLSSVVGRDVPQVASTARLLAVALWVVTGCGRSVSLDQGAMPDQGALPDQQMPAGGGTSGSGGVWTSSGGSGAMLPAVDPALPDGAGGSQGPAASLLLAPAECLDSGLVFTAGCSGCPEDAIACDCIGELGMLIRCNYGRCLRSVDCALLCSSGETPDPLEYFLLVAECLESRPCWTNGDCGAGTCVGETPTRVGSCSPGTIDNACETSEDCLSGKCTSGEFDTFVCSNGYSGDACHADSDCVSRNCIFTATEVVRPDGESVPVGICTTGGAAEACASDVDCLAPGYCFRPSSIQVGRCQWGDPGDDCVTNPQCASGACVHIPAGSVAGVCNAGTAGDRCVMNAECTSNLCAAPPQVAGAEEGICVTGDNHDLCYDADDCQSANCALEGQGGPGICTAGSIGDPCYTNDDCAGGYCDDNQVADTPICDGVRPGDACPGGTCMRFEDRLECVGFVCAL